MDLQEVLTELPSVRSFCLPPSMAPSCMNHPEQFMTSWAPHNKSKKEKSLENISVLSSKWRKTDMVPTPQRIYFLSCFGLNWSWWRALSPNPTLMPLSLWISAKFIFATSTHRVVTLFLFLHWHLWQQSSPTPAPRDTDCDSLCITLEPYMVEGREGSGLRQGPSVVHCLTANSASVCLCTFMDELWSESHFDDFSSFFSLSLCTPLPLLFHRWPTIGRTRTSERTTELHEEHLQSTTLEKKRLHWRTRETTRWDTSTPP